MDSLFEGVMFFSETEKGKKSIILFLDFDI